VDENLEERRQKLEEALWYLGRIQPLPPAAFTPIADQNWMEAWKQHYQPIPVGKRLIIVPIWLDSPEPERIPIRIDPGMAFGTGTHPTTQLCLELLEEWVPIDDVVIDVGCGSGILSIAALKLGATHALGVDIEDEAVRSARENANANGIGAEFVLGPGSVREIIAEQYPYDNAPLVITNILAPIILHLLDEGLADLVARDGALILSGILQEQAESVISAAQAHGLDLVEQRQMGDWVAQVYEYNRDE
jgi:ribosomal protein L11 methyltransferase